MVSSTKPRHRDVVKLEIENFQSHKHSVFDFVSGVNLITGSSNHGKSACARAINWVFYNRPNGDTFIRKGADCVTVKVTMRDGTVVTREKDRKGLNAYYIEGPNYPERIEKHKVGETVPEEVQKALGMPPKDKYHGPLAYVDQMSPLFFVSLSETELPRAISAMIGISSFEKAGGNLFSQSKQFTAKLKESKIEVEKKTKELESYRFIEEERLAMDKTKDSLEKAERIQDELELVTGYVNSYANILVLSKQAVEAIKEADAVLQHKKKVDRLSELKRQYEAVSSYKEQTIELVKREKKIQSEIQKLNAVVGAYPIQKQRKVEDIKRQLFEVQKYLDLLKDYRIKYASIKGDIDQLDKDIVGYKVELQKTQKQIEELGGLCPTCGQEVHYE